MPFKPNYKITDTILNNISQISSGREIIEHSRIIPRWEIKLKKEARLHNAHSSTSIEGNPLTLEQVTALAEKQTVIASDKDKQEVVNYLRALDLIPEYAGKPEINTELFLEIHKTVSLETLRELKDCGNFRDRQVFVGSRIFDGTQFKEIVEYMPPKTEEVQGLVKEFLTWLNSEEAKNINPVILAGIAHYEVARIHPFIDGNGRTARLLASLILYKRGFDHRRFFALDDYYDENRAAYYAALKTVQQAGGEITKWLEYFTTGVLDSINRVKETILKLGLGASSDQAESVELTLRQIKIVERIKTKGKITNKEIREIFNISRQAILKEINKLVNAKIIKLIGKGRGAYYRLEE